MARATLYSTLYTYAGSSNFPGKVEDLFGSESFQTSLPMQIRV